MTEDTQTISRLSKSEFNVATKRLSSQVKRLVEMALVVGKDGTKVVDYNDGSYALAKKEIKDWSAQLEDAIRSLSKYHSVSLKSGRNNTNYNYYRAHLINAKGIDVIRSLVEALEADGPITERYALPGVGDRKHRTLVQILAQTGLYNNRGELQDTTEVYASDGVFNQLFQIYFNDKKLYLNSATNVRVAAKGLKIEGQLYAFDELIHSLLDEFTDEIVNSSPKLLQLIEKQRAAGRVDDYGVLAPNAKMTAKGTYPFKAHLHIYDPEDMDLKVMVKVFKKFHAEPDERVLLANVNLNDQFPGINAYVAAEEKAAKPTFKGGSGIPIIQAMYDAVNAYIASREDTDEPLEPLPKPTRDTVSAYYAVFDGTPFEALKYRARIREIVDGLQEISTAVVARKKKELGGRGRTEDEE